jgi:hypothetical protein
VNQPNYKPPSYPVVQFLVVKGTALAVFVALCTFLLMAYAGYATTTLWLYPASVAAAAGVFIILMSYVEVLKIIADTLLPKY